jgi:restriction endonuclease Mrr
MPFQIQKMTSLTASILLVRYFSKLAIEEGQDPSKGKTIDLIDGDRLCDLLREYKIGIKEKNEVNIDQSFFENI